MDSKEQLALLLPSFLIGIPLHRELRNRRLWHLKMFAGAQLEAKMFVTIVEIVDMIEYVLDEASANTSMKTHLQSERKALLA